MYLITAKVFPKWKEIRWYWNSRILLVNTGWRAAELSPWLLYSYSKLCMKSATQSHFKIQTMNQKKSFWRQIKQLANSNFSVFRVFADSSRTVSNHSCLSRSPARGAGSLQFSQLGSVQSFNLYPPVIPASSKGEVWGASVRVCAAAGARASKMQIQNTRGWSPKNLSDHNHLGGPSAYLMLENYSWSTSEIPVSLRFAVGLVS